MALHDIFIDPSTHDIDFDDFRITSSSGEAIAQKVKIRLLTFLGEWHLDKSIGTAWFEKILRKGATDYVVDQEIRKRTLETEGVRAITSFSSEFDQRNRSYSCRLVITTDLDEDVVVNITQGE